MTDNRMAMAGWVLSGLFALFMLGASVLPKLTGMPVAADTMTALGWENSPVMLIGMIELVCTLLYIFPRTAYLGAVLMMAVLGGAIATQLRAGSPLVSHTLFGVYLGLAMWGGLWLRDPVFRSLFPFRRG